uniref:Uncharacterized protein n=1 Tax=Octopus bimaculoides TaxID=37653 RepID=A0A0L8IHW9_OCTBM
MHSNVNTNGNNRRELSANKHGILETHLTGIQFMTITNMKAKEP